MATLKTIYKGNLRTEVTHLQSNSVIITDAPTDNFGKGEHFSPTDLFAASFGSCMLTIMGIAAKNHKFDIDGTTVETTKVMAENPRRISEIIVEVVLPHNNYSEKERKILEKSVKECPVAQSLHQDIKQTVNFLHK
jgi:uncharacterized OsmC-like protein